jgi:iron complex outermembrane receptor protein
MHEWFEGDQFYDMAALPRSLWSATTFDQESDTVSVFAEGTYAITPTLDVIGGLRYSFDHKTATSETSSPSGTGFMGASGRVSARESYHGLSPELTLRYRPTESVLTFAKVGRGYKSGGISPFIDAGNTPNRYDPETTTSVEVGAKTSWFDDRLRVNGSLFYTDWREQQAVIQLTPTTRVIRNAASATSKGAELEASLLLMEGLTLGANYGFLHARYDEFTDSVLGRDYSGNALPYAPEHSAGLNLDWTHPLVDDLDLKGGLSYAYRSSYAFSPDNAYRQTPTHIVDARIGVEGNGWSVDLWAKNLSDERYLTQYFDFGGVDTGVAAEGRVLGLTVAAQW